MKNIEDCLETLDELASIFPYNSVPGKKHPSEVISAWDLKFISDVSTHTTNGSPVSTAQAEIILKLLRRYIGLFKPAEQPILESLLAAPEYRHPLHTSLNFPRQVRWAGGTTLLFRFKYNAPITNDLKTIDNCFAEVLKPYHIREFRAWKVIVDNRNYQRVMSIIKRHNFEFDDAVAELFVNIENNLEQTNNVELNQTDIVLNINNDVFASLWLADMEWLKNV